MAVRKDQSRLLPRRSYKPMPPAATISRNVFNRSSDSPELAKRSSNTVRRSTQLFLCFLQGNARLVLLARVQELQERVILTQQLDFCGKIIGRTDNELLAVGALQ